MSYRSDVAYAINFADEDILKAFVATAIIKDEKYREALDECLIDHINARICFFASNVKWYYGYEGVESHKALMRLSEELFEDDSGCRFVRMGEDVEDAEDAYYGHHLYHEWDLYMRREISTPFNPHYKPTGVQDYLDGLKEVQGVRMSIKNTKNYSDSFASRMERIDEFLDGTKGIDRKARLKTYDIDDLADFAGYLGADQAQFDRVYSVLIDIIGEVSE